MTSLRPTNYICFMHFGSKSTKAVQTSYPSVLDFLKIKHRWITKFLTCKNPFRNRFCRLHNTHIGKIQFVELDFSNFIFQKLSADGQGVRKTCFYYLWCPSQQKMHLIHQDLNLYSKVQKMALNGCFSKKNLQIFSIAFQLENCQNSVPIYSTWGKPRMFLNT